MFRKREHFFAAVILIFAILIAAAILSFPFVLKEIKDEEPLISKIKLSVKTFVKPEQAPLVSEPTVAPDKVEFRVDPEIAVIKDSELLPVDDWKTYHYDKYDMVIKYPKDWYVIHPAKYDELENFEALTSFSTSPSGVSGEFNERGESIDYENWASVGLSIEKKSKQETLDQWLKKQVEHFGPGIDAEIQYVFLDDKKFPGTFPFVEASWKNAYFKISDEEVLILRFMQKSNYNQSKIFYTMLKTLKLAATIDIKN